MRPITPLGKYLRKLRIDHDISLRSMAELAGVSYAFAAMVENGSRKPPESYLQSLSKIFGDQHLDRLMQLGCQQMDFLRLNIKNRSCSTREALAKFVCCIDSLNDEQVEAILTVMSRRQ